jgi:hypothetical protein
MHTFRLLLVLALFAAGSASAQVYRWVDANGRVHYSNDTPPPGANAKKLDIDARPGPVSPDTQECYTLRCQGERMEERVARRDETDARITAQRVATTPPAVSSQKARGLEFRKYISIQRGMSEGELVGIAGAPDLLSRERGSKTYTYLPIVGDPFTTTIVLVSGRVREIERVRQF